MIRLIGSSEVHGASSLRGTNRDAWPPEDARDAWWEHDPESARKQRLARRLAGLRQVGRRLFVHGGISVVFLFGLMA